METQTQTQNRRDLEQALIAKCWKDAEFLRQVTADPKGMLERHLGRKLPDNLNIHVHSEDTNTIHLSIPPMPRNISELSDEELEKVAGGTEVLYVTIVWAAVATAAAVGVGVAGGVTESKGW